MASGVKLQLLKHMFTPIKNKRGFTLMETIVALGIGLLATTMIFYIFTLGLKNVEEIKNTQALNSSAIFFIDRATYLIKQGGNFSTTTDGSIEKLNFFINGDSEEIASSTFGSYDIDVTKLKFALMARSIQLTFTIEKDSKTLSGQTTIAQRAF
jgi:prepilin-type N-terminal cleavage/methylation domain-containing protein